MPLLRKKCVIACSAEASSGTAETLDASDGAFNAYNSDASPGVTMGLREGQSAMSPLLAIPGQRIGTISFETDIATAPAWEHLLGSCGMYEGAADIWTPSSTSSQWTTQTIAKYMDGKVYQIFGAMGTVNFQFRAGQVARALFTFTGVLNSSAWGADATILAPTYPLTAASAARWAGATLTVGGSAVKVSSLDIGINNQITMLEDATSAAGVYRAWIASRAVGGTIDAEETLAATRDDFGNWLTPTELALVNTYGSMTFSVPKLQYINLPTGDRNGVSVVNATWQANRSAAAGDDELSINLTV